MKNRKKSYKSSKGITLIALVITIVILIILASIAIGQLTSSGIIGKADEAKVKTNQQTAIEQMNLKISSIQMSGYAENNSLTSLQYLADKLCDDNEMQYVEKESKATASLNKIDTTGCESIFTKMKAYPYEFEINSSLQLASINGVDLIASNPDSGNTQTPIDTSKTGLWTVWLALASVDYTKYDENSILNDSNLMDIVMNNEKSVDYLIQSKTFLYPAVAKNQVAMNALKSSSYAVHKCIENSLLEPESLLNNTNKNYSVNAQYVYNDSYKAENATDGNINTCWLTKDSWNWGTSDTTNCYYKVNFNNPVLLKKFDYSQPGFNLGVYRFATIKLYGVKDDGTKVLLGNNDNPNQSSVVTESMNITTNEYFSNYEIDLTRGGDYGLGLSDINFYGFNQVK